MPMNEKKQKQCHDLYAILLDNISDYVEKYAEENPDKVALIEHNTGAKITWKEFNNHVDSYAAKLLSVGLKKGDIVATTCVLLKEHVFLMYACYRIGVIIAPLDLRLKVQEVQYSMDKMNPKAYFFLGKTSVADFRPIVEDVMKKTPSIKTYVQIQEEKDLVLNGAVCLRDFMSDAGKIVSEMKSSGAIKKAREQVKKTDPCLIIFTTGSTGSPKPALLSHHNILVQNIGLVVGLEMTDQDSFLVNLPPSHVGCTTELLQTPIYCNATSVLLHIFDPKLSMEAIEQHKVTLLGQIPSLFSMEWRLPDYDKYDLSSLRLAIYGGQAVPRSFLDKMQTMAPNIFTGLGLTESAGFCTYTDIPSSVDDISKGIGFDMPLFPISIRDKMKEDGYAGDEKPKGEVGEICFSGHQVFLGYLGDPENTAKAISKDGFLYTGDVGYYDENGLHFSGRSKMVIKPKGYQVFPGDVENHISKKLIGKVSAVGCVGAEHDVFTEAIMAFVEVIDGKNVTAGEVIDACQDISSYSRPTHVEILKQGTMPLNRVAKTDYVVLKEKAKEIVKKLRFEGKWDKLS